MLPSSPRCWGFFGGIFLAANNKSGGGRLGEIGGGALVGRDQWREEKKAGGKWQEK
jgi:hypothetical protein